MHPNRFRHAPAHKVGLYGLRGNLHKFHLHLDHFINERFWLIIRVIALLAMIIILSVFANSLGQPH